MKKVLIIVDMQNDFIDGVLGTKEAQAIVPNIKKKIEEYNSRGDAVIFTRDTHFENYLKTNEGKNLPYEHCIYNTKGWEIHSDLEDVHCCHIDKTTFGYERWKDVFAKNIEYIELCGVCTDICVVSNALILKAAYPEAYITVDANCCAGVTPEKHKAALEAMKSCQIVILNETPSVSEEKGCVGCMYEGISHNNYPCCDCARNSKDYYLKEVH